MNIIFVVVNFFHAVSGIIFQYSFFPEVEPRTQGQGHKKNPRPRTAFPRTDTLEAKDRNARGQGPRTRAQVLSKKKNRLHKNFSGDFHKKMFSKKFFKRSTKFLQFKK